MVNVTKVHSSPPIDIEAGDLDLILDHLNDADAIAEALMSQDEKIAVEGPQLVRLGGLIHREIEAVRNMIATAEDRTRAEFAAIERNANKIALEKS